jgi:radical SAM protein (TIGR01212 family)
MQTELTASPFGDRRYNAWNDYVKEKHGGRIQKVSVISGFTCPNRDGLLGTGGCSFCNNAGFTPSYLDRRWSIHEQIDAGLEFLRRRYPRTRHFIAYFQSYSNTYGEFERLRACYEEALAHPEINGLAIGTRPDCLPEEVLDYLGKISRQHIIELEIGVESCCDAALTRVNRGHDFATSVDAIHRAAKHGLEVTAHLIFGLPGESTTSMINGARQLSALPLRGLKLHQLEMVRGTPLAREWQQNPSAVQLLGEDEYISLVADFIEHLSPEILLQRLGSEVPPKLKLAPNWNLRLHELAPRVSAELAHRGTWQGCRYHAPHETKGLVQS